MKIDFKNYSSVGVLISSIIFFILGAVMFTNPEAVVLVVSYVIGGLIIILGVYKCIKNYVEVKKDNQTSSKEMVLGITLVVIGLVFIFLANVIEALVRLVIGGWILFSGINRLSNALILDKKSTKFFVLLGISVVLILGGLYTILETNLAFKAIGIVLMIYSGIEIFGYIFNKNTVTVLKTVNVVKKEEVKEALVIENKGKSKKSLLKKK